MTLRMTCNVVVMMRMLGVIDRVASASGSVMRRRALWSHVERIVELADTTVSSMHDRRVIDEHRGRFRVEPICRVLGVSASTYYQRATGQRSARAVEDERVVVNGDLPFAAMMFKGKIEQALREQMTKVLA